MFKERLTKEEDNMLDAIEEHALNITVTSQETMELDLNSAVQMIIEIAKIDRRSGILVTRRGPQTFTVSLSPDVPYGLTREAQAW